MARCRAALVSAPSSGQGKTTLTAALARQAHVRGERVRVFKTGPDFLDPMILERASGAPVYQLDLFMGGRDHCRRLIAAAAREADLILVEGVMGLFDGDPSSAHLAEAFGLPVVAVIDGSAMAQTFGAVVQGLATFRPGLRLAGVFANRVGGERHARMLLESLPNGIAALGWLPRRDEIALPERHLGLVSAGELLDLEARIARAAKALTATPLSLPTLEVDPESPASLPRSLAGRHIAIARDAAFTFIYPANVDVLRALGADCAFFSPLADATLPDCDAVWLPGGYPELHATRIASNTSMRASMRAHQAAGKPMLAECGGMMALFEEMHMSDGSSTQGFALLAGRTRMHRRFTALGLQTVPLPEGELRGHSFHCSTCETPLRPIAHGVDPNGGPTHEAVYRQARLTASYVHLYFPSNPHAVAALFSP